MFTTWTDAFFRPGNFSPVLSRYSRRKPQQRAMETLMQMHRQPEPYGMLSPRQELTEQVILENMRQVMNGRLYCLPGSQRQEQEWWHEDPLFTRLKQVIDGVEHCFDVMFVDCGSRKDDFAKRILMEADVCVLNMTQEEERVGDYFRDPPGWKGKTFFLIGNYFSDGLYTRRNLERLYRVDGELLGAVPYNPRMQAAGRTGGTDRRLKEYIGAGMRGKNAEFERELLRTVRLILKLAGVEA